MPNAYVDHRNPIIKAMEGFDRPKEVCAIVSKVTQMHFHYIFPCHVLFFGYRKQCEENMDRYPDSIILEGLQKRIIDDK